MRSDTRMKFLRLGGVMRSPAPPPPPPPGLPPIQSFCINNGRSLIVGGACRLLIFVPSALTQGDSPSETPVRSVSQSVTFVGSQIFIPLLLFLL